MTNTTYSSSQHLVMIYHPEYGTIDLNDLQLNDTLVINTHNNLYSFRITNREFLRGKLSKSHAEQGIEAVLVGALIPEPHRPKMLRAKLQLHAHALFLVLHNDQFVELATSPVVGISLVTASVPGAEAAEAVTKRIQSAA